MRRRALCVAGGSNIAEHGAWRNPVSDFESRSVLVEMSVVINAAAGPDYRNCLTAEIVLTNVVDESVRCGENRCSSWREDVLTFVQASCTTWRMPRVGDCPLRDVFQRH